MGSMRGRCRNFFVEYPPIRPRLLAGFVAHKYKSDALLYYAMNGWASYGKGVPYNLDAVSSTLNVTYFRNVNATYDGEGQLVVPAPVTSRCAITPLTRPHNIVFKISIADYFGSIRCRWRLCVHNDDARDPRWHGRSRALPAARKDDWAGLAVRARCD